jgi:hypothetical protein
MRLVFFSLNVASKSFPRYCYKILCVTEKKVVNLGIRTRRAKNEKKARDEMKKYICGGNVKGLIK